ncbi:IS1096 element passenger TnpR family protein [Kordia sp.]|uniref:IS1096 element passenger TnpR family protein n=1 Tax=Kordia sp. TaxID=1965332 RepID=UPI003D27F13B
MIYRFRVILDAKEDVFRDIEIQEDATFEDFHNAITQAFGFDGMEMASFYVSDDEWNQGEEISQFDMSEGQNSIRLMNETTLDGVLSEDQTRLIYVYDFLNMWTFLVELAEIAEPVVGELYPNLLFTHGILPDSAPDKQFEAEQDPYGLKDDDEDLDINDYDSLNFDENWN